MKTTSFEEFARLASQGTFVPVYKEIMADLLTPVSAFLKIAEHSDYAFLLESVEGGEQVARYSFLGKDPFLILRSRDGISGGAVYGAGRLRHGLQPARHAADARGGREWMPDHRRARDARRTGPAAD
jgi:anthranilate/para-aminobenzoate synthase component I